MAIVRHNRMPVILRREDEDEWLNPDRVEPEQLLPLLHPYPAHEMEAYPIASAINVPTNDTEAVIQPLNST
jgi:putative SOS response-associated peptidase YedK